MGELPFNIPPSLISFVEQYEAAPKKTTKRLRKQMEKRGANAVGYFLLAWFYHKQEHYQKAIDYALRAKNHAPGSPFLENLHYFFSHPHLFEAWQNPAPGRTNASAKHAGYSSAAPVPDLDALIQKLSEVELKRIKFDPDYASEHSSPADDEADNIVSETLARIHEQQGKFEAALQAYKKLTEIHPGKKEFYDKQIKRLEKLKNEESQKES